MMLDIDFAQLREGFQRYAPLGAVIGAILLVELFMVLATWRFAPAAATLRLNPTPEGVTNAEALGRILYTDNILLFQGAGLVLLVAMIGAIVLTLRERPGTRRQNIAEQVARSGTVSVRAVPTGAGLKEIGILRPPSPQEEAPKQVEHHHGHGGHH
jgi:NADH-quinone oxidoreductase subunit J